jgi:cell division protein FtsZ
VVASMAKEMGALTVAVVTSPFAFEGARRLRQAEEGLAQLAKTVDTVISIPNERLLSLAPRGTTILEAFRLGHDFVRQVIQDIVEIATTPGFVNRDFSDLRSTLNGAGYAVLGTATARGENAATEAARQAIACPLVEGQGIRGARNILLNVTGSSRLGLHEVNDACNLVREAAGPGDVQLNFGIVVDDSLGDAVKVTLIATGFGPAEPPAAPAPIVAEQPAAATAWLAEPAPAPLTEPVIELKPPNGHPPLPQPEFANELDMPAILRRQRM